MANQAGTSEGPTVDSWSDKDQRIVVSQPAAGFLYDLVLRAKIDGDPDDVYSVLKDPNSHEIFRGIRATLRRTTLEDDGKGRRKLRIGHRALTKFLWISVTFDTELYVWEDDVARTIRFTNARSDGFMQKFDGTWHVQPFTQQTLDSIYKGTAAAAGGSAAKQDKGHNWLGGILHHGGHSSSSSHAGSALVTLNQALAPRARPPGPVAHLVRGLCGRVLTNMMEDLRTEVARRQQQQQLAASESVVSKSLVPQPFFSPGSGSKARQAAGSSRSLPVASLTLSSGCAGRCGSNSKADAEDSSRKELAPLSRPNLLSSAGDALGELMAAAIPLHITVQL